MNLIGRRRLSRLEKRVASVVAERKRREPEVMAWRRQAALYHATKLATLILHGNPQIDEPLAIAWERALGRLGLSGTPQELLYYRLRAVLADLPGRCVAGSTQGYACRRSSYSQTQSLVRA
jgi:hypothetical protein